MLLRLNLYIRVGFLNNPLIEPVSDDKGDENVTDLQVLTGMKGYL
jgi:hypothetical protein